MGLYKYSVVEAEGEKIGKAQLHDVNCSYKDLSQVFLAIKYKSLEKAESIIEAAISKEKAIPYKRFATKIGHRSELRGQKGRYPKKECKIALQILQNARANAIAKGLDETALYVKHAAAYKQNVLKRYRNYFANSRTLGYGKNSMWSNYETCWAELFVGERPSKEKDAGSKVKAVKKVSSKVVEAKPSVAEVKPHVKVAKVEPAVKKD